MQYSFWHTIPIVRLLIPFASGIGVSMFYEVSFELAFAGFCLLFLLALAIQFLLQKFKHRWLFGAIVTLCLFAGGFALRAYQNELRNTKHFIYQPTAQGVFIMLDELPIAKQTVWKCKAKVMGITDSTGKVNTAIGSVLVYLQKGIISDTLTYGDVLSVQPELITTIKGPQNPEEFNYKRYLAFNNIFFQVYLSQSQIKVCDQNYGSRFKKWVVHTQLFFKSTLTRCIGSANESAVAQALLYGNDDDINPETVQAYANTGTLHVLAVSGMHVGLIFMLLQLFFKPLNNLRYGKIAKHILILIALWLYSFLCGMSPSILRATVMFTFIIIADMASVKSSVYNTLAASAFVLLCFNSNMLANVGFQLSYLAVLGIVFFQPLIQKWYTPTTWLAKQIWLIIAVSIAAQLITFPVGFLYFHQFPNCFLFSNLLIIPLTTLIIYLCILLVMLSPFSWLSWLIGQCVFGFIYATNWLVSFVEKIPYAYINGIHISIVQTVLLYIILFSVTLYFLLKRKYYIFIFLVSCIVFFAHYAYARFGQLYQQKVVVYSINKHTAIQFITGCEATLIADKELTENKSKVKFHMLQYNWKNGINAIQTKHTQTNWQRISFKNDTYLITGAQPILTSTQCDILIVKDELPLESLLFISPQKVIVTGSVKPTKALRIKEWFAAKNIPVTYVTESGAIEL
jgi:competence protein ComEC